MKLQKKIVVVAAVLTKQSKQQCFFIAKRADGAGWEFPGGKIEHGESPQVALKREIKEELGCEITVGEWLGRSEVDVGEKCIVMDAFVSFCEPMEISLREHLDSAWITAKEIDNYRWAPADIPLLDTVRTYFTQSV
jgi:8-oxo-dGTP diphosphatase